jgi:hypothetical protein
MFWALRRCLYTYKYAVCRATCIAVKYAVCRATCIAVKHCSSTRVAKGARRTQHRWMMSRVAGVLDNLLAALLLPLRYPDRVGPSTNYISHVDPRTHSAVPLTVLPIFYSRVSTPYLHLWAIRGIASPRSTLCLLSIQNMNSSSNWARVPMVALYPPDTFLLANDMQSKRSPT